MDKMEKLSDFRYHPLYKYQRQTHLIFTNGLIWQGACGIIVENIRGISTFLIYYYFGSKFRQVKFVCGSGGCKNKGGALEINRFHY